MQVSDKLIRPLTETKYLNADNVDRYRSIMRIFFENYEKLRYWMYQEDVYAQMKQDPYFADYRMEQCQQDLAALTEWKNLVTIQDTRKVASIEEFRNKKFRYQMSEYSVEIERLVLRLENLLVEGASLEPTLLERIRLALERFGEMEEESADTVYTWWNDLNNDFIRLNQNYQDYIRDLSSVKAEEMMRTREFLVFKDKLVEYLRSFIRGLQRNVGVIEECLRMLDSSVVEKVLGKAVEYELSIPRMDTEVSAELLKERDYGRYQSIRDWFVSEEGRENEAGKLFDATNDIIRRITRYAAQLSEKNALSANRKEEYRHVAEIFMKCRDVQEAHRMSAMVFGLERPFHLKGDFERDTDSMNVGVYEEEPTEFLLKPRIRSYKEKTNRSAIRDTREEKAREKERLLQEMQRDRQEVERLEQDGAIDFAALPVIQPRVREILLKWLSDALEDDGYTARTEDGRLFTLDLEHAEERCVVRCSDGIFTMPRLRILFSS
ncbi:MAG: TIGR02677 family protein [Lachnospiraceae bacterium]|nr:TIGR02677 family protein [Lachnospiraceae bacterium]